ncbi:hypothetical protein ACHAWF_018705 [Thalassiosira exigua]
MAAATEETSAPLHFHGVLFYKYRNIPDVASFFAAQSSSCARSDIAFFRRGDLTVKQVNEIIATNGAVVDMAQDGAVARGGKHLTPAEFHEALLSRHLGADTIVVDVRSTFEHAIGSFDGAIEPGMRSFQQFDKWAEQAAPALRDKKVLMYCTGGVRCEKASAMLVRRGVRDVSQLAGGIHRYLERYPSDGGGMFRGRNFVFDQRVSVSSALSEGDPPEGGRPSENVRGRCAADSCGAPGQRVCAVCRDFVLVCRSCAGSLREYHCPQHSYLQDCFFAHIDGFDVEELESHGLCIKVLLDEAEAQVQRRAAAQRQRSKKRRLGAGEALGGGRGNQGEPGASGESGAYIVAADHCNKMSEANDEEQNTVRNGGDAVLTAPEAVPIPKVACDDRRAMRKQLRRINARVDLMRGGRAAPHPVWVSPGSNLGSKSDEGDEKMEEEGWRRRCRSCGRSLSECNATRDGPLTRCAAKRATQCAAAAAVEQVQVESGS